MTIDLLLYSFIYSDANKVKHPDGMVRFVCNLSADQ